MQESYTKEQLLEVIDMILIDAERQSMLNIISTYHKNLFYIPLKDGENEQILDYILNETIESKIEQ
jgi:hypothetical protein